MLILYVIVDYMNLQHTYTYTVTYTYTCNKEKGVNYQTTAQIYGANSG